MKVHAVNCKDRISFESIKWCTMRLKQPQSFNSRRNDRNLTSCLGTTFTDSNGTTTTSDKSQILVGTDSGSDLKISGPNTFPKHAEISRSKSRTTCTALIGDEDDLLADTYTWLDGNQLRTGVGYILSPASMLSFGEEQNTFKIDFEETKQDTTTLEMLIKGMASQSSQEVKDQFDL